MTDANKGFKPFKHIKAWVIIFWHFKVDTDDLFYDYLPRGIVLHDLVYFRWKKIRQNYNNIMPGDFFIVPYLYGYGLLL